MIPDVSPTGGGTPYGASHVAGQRTDGSLTADERTLANALGRWLADVAARLEQKP